MGAKSSLCQNCPPVRHRFASSCGPAAARLMSDCGMKDGQKNTDLCFILKCIVFSLLLEWGGLRNWVYLDFMRLHKTTFLTRKSTADVSWEADEVRPTRDSEQRWMFYTATLILWGRIISASLMKLGRKNSGLSNIKWWLFQCFAVKLHFPSGTVHMEGEQITAFADTDLYCTTNKLNQTQFSLITQAT